MRQVHTLFSRMFGNEFEQTTASTTESSASTIIHYEPLLELQDKRQLVRVDVLNNMHPNSYQSMIVRIDFLQRQLYLDALTPLNPFCPVAIGDTLVVSHHNQGSILTFRGELQAVTTDGGELFYVLNLPTEIGYKQRRFHPRLAIDRVGMVKLRLWSPLRIPWHARVNNISAGGARLTVCGNITQQLKKNTMLPNCDIQLETGQNLNCKAIVKAFRFQRRPYEHTEISIEFSDLGFRQKNWLLQWVDFHGKKVPTGMTAS